MTQEIWIDTRTGSWGGTEGLRVLEVSDDSTETLYEMPDSEICEFGQKFGDAMGKIPVQYTYTVHGKGQFPVDMLRYDRCSPKSTNDARGILSTEERKIELVSLQPPTEGRWSSFGWTLVWTQNGR